MTTTTKITSVTVEVADQDRALAFYRDVLGCRVRADVELWPGGRWLEVAPPGSDVGIALLTRASGFPLGVRYGTTDADAAHAALRAAGVEPHEGVLRLDFAPPMFTLDDPDGNTVVLIEDEEEGGGAGAGVTGVLAGCTVSDLEAAEHWYTTLFGRAPDARPMDGLLEWHLGEGFGVQVWRDASRAGRSSTVLGAGDLDAVAARLTGAGIAHGGPAPGGGARVLQLTDPDGNSVVFAGP